MAILAEIREKLRIAEKTNPEHDELMRRLSMSSDQINAEIEFKQSMAENIELGKAVSKEFNIPLVHYEHDFPDCYDSRLAYVLGTCIYAKDESYMRLAESAKSIEGIYDYKGFLYIKMPWFTDFHQEIGRASVVATLHLAADAWENVGESSETVKIVRAGREFELIYDTQITMSKAHSEDFFFNCRHHNHPALGVD